MELIIKEILKKENITYNKIEKSKSGFTNLVYLVDDKYVIKIPSNNPKKLLREIEFYKNESFYFIPKLITYGEYNLNPYLIIEQINGKTIYSVFHTLTETERKNIVKEICDILKAFNKKDCYLKTGIDWCKKWENSFELNIKLLKEKNIDTSFVEYFKNVYLHSFMEETKPCLVYNDTHFDNFLITSSGLKLIDFDRVMYASLDYELLILDSMLDSPHKFANEEDENNVNKNDYKNLRDYFKEFYSELYDFKYSEERLFIYKFIYKLASGFEYDRLEWLQNAVNEFEDYFESKVLLGNFMKEIDIEKWNRKKQFYWFNSFSNPCYNMNVKIDCTRLIEFTKEHNQSFFINFMYLVMKGLNSVEEMRLRYVDGKVYLYDIIHPAYTVMTNSGVFENVRHPMKENYKAFYKLAKRVIDKAKIQEEVKEEYNTNSYNEYYLTTVPWVNFSGLTHPIPDDKNSLNVPRVCWGKYQKEGEKYFLTLNICVSHVLVDGYPLSKAFNNVQQNVLNCEDLLK